MTLYEMLMHLFQPKEDKHLVINVYLEENMSQTNADNILKKEIKWIMWWLEELLVSFVAHNALGKHLEILP